MKIIGLFIVVFMLFGCSDIDRGYVYDKTHEDQWVQTTYMYINKVMIPQTIIHPEKWTAYIKSDTEKGYCNISESSFYEIKIGDFIYCE